MPRSGDRDEGAAGQRDTDRLALAAVDVAVAEVAACEAGDGRPVQAVRTGHVAVDERGDHQVTLADSPHLSAGLLDHADELMPDRPGCVRRLAPVVPQVRPAYAAQHHPHDGVGRLLDHRIRPLSGLDCPRPVEYRSSHG